MKLHHQIITQHVHAARELDPRRQRAIQADSEAGRLLKENQALSLLREQVPAAPAWEEMRTRLTAGVVPTKENPMSMLSRLTTGKPWYFRLGFALLLVLALTALALMLPLRHGLQPGTPAWADTSGYLLTIILPVSGELNCGTDCDPGQACPELAAAETAIQEWSSALDAAHEAEKAAGSEPQEVKLRIAVNLNQQEGAPATLMLTVLAAGASPEELESLKQKLAEVPGLPAPTVESATWLSDGELSDPNCLGLRVMDQMLFLDIPADATEEEIEQQISEWYAREHPGEVPQIEVTKESETGPDGHPKVKVKIKINPAEQPAE